MNQENTENERQGMTKGRNASFNRQKSREWIQKWNREKQKDKTEK
jgi:hypothetical protein